MLKPEMVFIIYLNQEILLYLEKSSELRSNELTNALVELGKRKGASGMNTYFYHRNQLELT